MYSEMILRDALLESLEFISALLNRRDDDAIDLLSSAGENVEAMMNEALVRTATN